MQFSTLKKNRFSFITSCLTIFAFLFFVNDGWGQKTWTGGASDGLWASAANWSGNSVPISSDQVLLDNSTVSGNYTVTLPSGNVSTSLVRLTITPSGSNKITLVLPSGNTSSTGLSVGDNTSSTDDIILDNGAILKNSSGASSGNTIATNSTSNGTFRINNGGRYIHNTVRGATTGLAAQLSSVSGTELGIFEFDTPSGTSNFSPSASGRVYGSLVFSNTLATSFNYTVSGSTACTIRGNLEINANASFVSSMTAALNIAGDFIFNGTTLTIPSGQSVFFNGTNQNISGLNQISFVSPVTINSGSTLNISANSSISTTNTFTITGSLVLKSNTTGTGRIAASSGSFSGNVTVERYIAGGNSNGSPGRRAFRFLSHPFTSDLSLTPLLASGNIDISGVAGQGFTSTTTNNPSAFWYDPTAVGAGSGSNDPGWVAFNRTDGSTVGSNHNLWKSGNGIRVLFRGAKGEGLTFNGTNYTLSDVTLSLTGTINTGAKSFTLPASANDQWSLVGNPYPSPIDIRTLLFTKYNGGAGNIGTNAYVWNPNKSGTTRGGYDAIDISTAGSYILPTYGVVLVQNKTASANVINFAESDKSGTSANLGFRTLIPGTTIGVDLVDAENNEVLDDYNLRFDNKALTSTFGDTRDGGKLLNNYSIYSLSESDNRMLKVDSRPIPSTDESIVRLGIYSSSPKLMKINFTDLNLPLGMDAYLKDNFLNKKELITGITYCYNFEVTSDANSHGENRFELIMQKAPAPPITKLSVTVGPNPSTDFVQVKMQAPKAELTSLRIVGVDGKTVESMNLGSVDQINKQISVKRFVAGTYLLQVIHGAEVVTEKIIKQ